MGNLAQIPSKYPSTSTTLGNEEVNYIPNKEWTIDLTTAHPKWRLDGPALSGHLLYSLVK